jgi:cell division transport system permease protein
MSVAEPELLEPRAIVAARGQTALIPADTVASRALVVVIAIMTFLACLTAGAAMLIGAASQSWRSDVAESVTIQIRPKLDEDAEPLLAKVAEAARASPGVAEARALTAADTQALLEPWLGRGLDISKLPLPRLVVVRMKAGQSADLAPLRAAVTQASSEANLDDHSAWINRLTAMANVIVSFAGAVFLLVIVAMSTAIGFATRGAVANGREIVEVLHFVGASDSFVAKQFQNHFFGLGLRGSLAGGGAAALSFLAASGLSAWWRGSPGGQELAALFGAFSLNWLGYFGLIAICVGVTLLTAYLSRWIVLRYLRYVQ